MYRGYGRCIIASRLKESVNDAAGSREAILKTNQTGQLLVLVLPKSQVLAWDARAVPIWGSKFGAGVAPTLLLMENHITNVPGSSLPIDFRESSWKTQGPQDYQCLYCAK